MSGAGARRWLGHADFLAEHPYYAAVLARLDALEDARVERIALARGERRIYLMTTPAPLDAETEKALLMHAVHHVVMGHLSNPKLATPAHADLMRLAMEVSANEFVPYVLPCGPVWKDLEHAGLSARQSTAERYEALCAARRAGALAGELPEPTCDAGRLGGAAGEEGAPDEAALEYARALVSDAVASVDAPPRGRAGLLAGLSPGEALELLSPATRAPRAMVGWSVALAAFFSGARAPVHTYARPSRRFPARVGEAPGRAWAPRRGIRPRLMCAIDTSASLSTDDLVEVALQLEQIAAFADVTIVECDARIQRVYRFDGRLRSVRGRGGTDLRPPFAREVVLRFGPDGVVYFTDGLGPVPERAPGVPTLWVLTRDGPFHCPWGARARI